MHLVPCVVRYERSLVAQAALVDIDVKDIFLICERCDQVVSGGDVFVGDAVPVLGFLLCHEQVSLDKDQRLRLKPADIHHHIAVALVKAFRCSRAALVDADHQIDLGKLFFREDIVDRRLRVLVRDLGLFVIVDGERGLAQESRVLDPGVLADPDSAGVTDEAGVGKIVVGRSREIIDFRFLLHGGLRLGGIELRQDACDWGLRRGVRRLFGLPRDRDHTQIVDGVVGVETGQVCHVQSVVDPAHGCRQGRRGQRVQSVVVIVPEVPVESEGAEHQCGHCDQD